MNGHSEVVGKLLEKGSSVDIQDKNGTTALIAASAERGGGTGQTSLLDVESRCTRRGTGSQYAGRVQRASMEQVGMKFILQTKCIYFAK